MNLSSLFDQAAQIVLAAVEGGLKASVMSWMFPMPPPLSSNEIAANVCSVLG